MNKLTLKSADEAIRINASDGAELKYWSKKFGVNRDDIKRAVKEVGDSLSAVKDYFDRKAK
jgi:hypothetical protein